MAVELEEEDQSEVDRDWDEDGKPLSVMAAQKFYHSQGNSPVNILDSKKAKFTSFKSPFEANKKLAKGKKYMQEVLKQAKFQQMNKFGSQMAHAINFDNSVANMPEIRVVQQKKSAKGFQIAGMSPA